eukprot:Pgem_evm1s11069
MRFYKNFATLSILCGSSLAHFNISDDEIFAMGQVSKLPGEARFMMFLQSSTEEQQKLINSLQNKIEISFQQYNHMVRNDPEAEKLSDEALRNIYEQNDQGIFDLNFTEALLDFKNYAEKIKEESINALSYTNDAKRMSNFSNFQIQRVLKNPDNKINKTSYRLWQHGKPLKEFEGDMFSLEKKLNNTLSGAALENPSTDDEKESLAILATFLERAVMQETNKVFKNEDLAHNIEFVDELDMHTPTPPRDTEYQFAIFKEIVGTFNTNDYQNDDGGTNIYNQLKQNYLEMYRGSEGCNIGNPVTVGNVKQTNRKEWAFVKTTLTAGGRLNYECNGYKNIANLQADGKRSRLKAQDVFVAFYSDSSRNWWGGDNLQFFVIQPDQVKEQKQVQSEQRPEEKGLFRKAFDYFFSDRRRASGLGLLSDFLETSIKGMDDATGVAKKADEAVDITYKTYHAMKRAGEYSEAANKRYLEAVEHAQVARQAVETAELKLMKDTYDAHHAEYLDAALQRKIILRDAQDAGLENKKGQQLMEEYNNLKSFEDDMWKIAQDAKFAQVGVLKKRFFEDQRRFKDAMAESANQFGVTEQVKHVSGKNSDEYNNALAKLNELTQRRTELLEKAKQSKKAVIDLDNQAFDSGIAMPDGTADDVASVLVDEASSGFIAEVGQLKQKFYNNFKNQIDSFTNFKTYVRGYCQAGGDFVYNVRQFNFDELQKIAEEDTIRVALHQVDEARKVTDNVLASTKILDGQLQK